MTLPPNSGDPIDRLFDEQPAAGPEGSRRSRRQSVPPRRRRRRWLPTTIVVVVVLALVGGGLAFAFQAFKPQIDALVQSTQPTDYEGDGTGEVVVQIQEGQTGADIGDTLEAEGVVLTSGAFYSAVLARGDGTTFQPGAYRVAEQMSAESALDALLDEENRLDSTVLVREGEPQPTVLQEISTNVDIPLDEVEAAAAAVDDFAVPDEAETLEGFLFPATYTFDPGVSATDVLTRMVDRADQAYDDAGVADADRWETAILASIVQREARIAEDFPKVARVFQNRIDGRCEGATLLQSDATVHYGIGDFDSSVETTPEDRADADNPYNTYANPGLPVGPISNPGDVAINAAASPAEGAWCYFVTWNLDTGETIFSETYEEHQRGVERWQDWTREQG